MPITIKGSDITKKIDGIITELKGINKEVAKISRYGRQVAKTTLMLGSTNANTADLEFMQKHGQSLAFEIGLVQTSPNTYEIVAPMSGKEDIAYEMYFAEYGAGLGSKMATKNVARTYDSSKTPPLQDLRPKSGYVRSPTLGNATLKYGYSLGDWWYYRTFNMEHTEDKIDKLGRPRKKVHSRWRFTNTSEPINYMYNAREEMRKELHKLTVKLKTKIRTKIKRNW